MRAHRIGPSWGIVRSKVRIVFMPDRQKDLEAVKATILAEFNAQGFGDEPLSFRKAMELREYAKARTDLHSENLTMEQAIWKSLYDGVTEELRKDLSRVDDRNLIN